jgi:hypothetical protein
MTAIPTLDECIEYLDGNLTNYDGRMHDVILSYLRSIPDLTAERDAATARPGAKETDHAG